MMRKLFILLMMMIPCVANAQDILTRLDKALGVSLPAEYRTNFKSFTETNKILCDEGSNAFTEQFIKDQMKLNLGINKQNQLLFVWNAIYHAITDKYIYEGDDGNDDRLDDYSTVMDEIDECEKQFRSKYIAYTKQRSAEAQQRSAEYDRQIAEYDRMSAEAQQRSAEAQQRSAEAQQRSAEYDRQIAEYDRMSAEAQQRSAEAQQRSAEAQQRSAEAQQRSAEYIKSIKEHTINTLSHLKKIYNLYLNDPTSITESEYIGVKKDAKQVIQICKKYDIDYKSILSPEVLKFYGIE